MMLKKQPIKATLIAVIASFLLVSGCSSPPVASDRGYKDRYEQEKLDRQMKSAVDEMTRGLRG